MASSDNSESFVVKIKTYKTLQNVSKRDVRLPRKRNCIFRCLQLLSFLESEGKDLIIPYRLRYFREPKTYPLDLNEGCEFYSFRRQTRPDEAHDKVEKFLTTIWSQCDDGLAEESLKNIDICTDLETLKKIMLTPYRMETEWTVVATRFNKRLFINLKQKDSYNTNNAEGAGDSSEYSNKKRKIKTLRRIYANKLTSYCFSDTPRTTPMSDDPVDENNELFALFRVKLLNIDIIYPAQVPGVISPYRITSLLGVNALKQFRFILMKTLRPVPLWRRHPRTLDWAAEAYLKFCNDICIGFYDARGYVPKPIEHFALQTLMEDQSWSLRVCLAFLHKTLQNIKSVMKDFNSTKVVYEFYYDAVGHHIIYRQRRAVNTYDCISKEFKNFVNKYEV